MQCFYVEKDQITGSLLKISGRELHHLTKVLRLREGDEITVFDGSGGIYKVLLKSVPHGSDRNAVAVGEIISYKQAQPSSVEVVLFQGLPKADKMDVIVQKSTELGASRIVPVLCHHSVPHLSAEKAQNRVSRWRQIAIEASKQSKRPFFPFVDDVVEFDSVIGGLPAGLRLIFIPPSADFVSPETLKDALKRNPNERKIAIFIGPEGDFSRDEVQKALSFGAIPVSLGNNILRTETAAISALAIVLYERSDLNI